MSDHLDNYNFEEIEKSIKRIKNNGSNSNLSQEIETNIINRESNDTISFNNNNPVLNVLFYFNIIIILGNSLIFKYYFIC